MNWQKGTYVKHLLLSYMNRQKKKKMQSGISAEVGKDYSNQQYLIHSITIDREEKYNNRMTRKT